jgi:hypothetical protein
VISDIAIEYQPSAAELAQVAAERGEPTNAEPPTR